MQPPFFKWGKGEGGPSKIWHNWGWWKDAGQTRHAGHTRNGRDRFELRGINDHSPPPVVKESSPNFTSNIKHIYEN